MGGAKSGTLLSNQRKIEKDSEQKALMQQRKLQFLAEST